MKKLLFLTLSILLLSITIPGFTQDQDGETVDPPPRFEPVSVTQTLAGSIDVAFSSDTEDAQVEVIKCCNGAKVYDASGYVSGSQRIAINTRHLCKGEYIVKVRINGRTVNETLVIVE